MRRLRSFLPTDMQAAWSSAAAVRAVVWTDFLVLVAELSAAVILPWWITSRGGAQAMAGWGAAVAVAAFLVAPLVSPLGDRVCKGRQIRAGVLCLGVVAATQAALSAADRFSLVGLAALALVQVIAASFVDPAREAVLAEQVPPALLPAAIRLRKTVRAVGGIAGPLLAGAVLAGAGITAALCAVGGLLAAALLTAGRIPRAAAATAASPGGAAAWWADLRAGLATQWRVPMERGWTLVNFVVWIFQGPAVGLLVPIKVHALGLQGPWLGLCLGAMSLGVLLGSAVGSPWLVARFGRYRVRIGLGCAEGLALAVAGWAASPGLLLVALTAAGFCNAAMSLVGATHRVLAIPREYRVRMHAARAMSTRVAGAIGPALVAAALPRWGVSGVYTLWGLLMAGAVLGFLAVPRLKEFLSLGHADIADWYRREYPAVFR